ncbi:MAG TPA: TonB-dependent receptor [Cyclobacteriaceae bacterium]|nr:TonB-dependent receptor [Cyclobacteriaceae bacterium]
MKGKLLVVLLVLLSGALSSYSQSLTSSITGVVRDNVSRKGVEGALVYLAGKGDTLSVVTDAQGRFVLNNVSAGRYICSVHSLGYESDIQETLVITGKTTIVEFALQEKVTELEALTIQARPTNNTEPGSISLPIEKVMRMPANFFDPVRMLSSYPGVVATNDQANNIAVKGNSPTGLLWRLNGMDIVNPNHLANAGTFNDKPTANGGGVNILSAQMLDRTDFYAGTMPARYGNLTSAALDMTLRTGNAAKREYTAQASLIGLDFAAEGPIGKNNNASYLANYRYSTVGLLSKMGVNFGDEKIDFQDFSFNVNTKTGERGSLSFFGFGGISNNVFNAKDSSEWKVDKDRFTIKYSNKTYAIGTRFDLALKKSFGFSTGVTISGNDQTRNAESIATDDLPLQRSDYMSKRTLVSAFAALTGKWSSKISSEIGVMINQYDDELRSNELLPAQTIDVGGSAESTLIQPYAQVGLRTGNFTASIGGRYMYSTFNATAFDPRVNLQYQLAPTSSLSLTFGQMSQMLAPGVYLMPQNSVGLRDFLKRKFVELGHMVQFDNWKINSSLFYHYYDKVPVSMNNNFSVLNYVEGIVTESLTPVGTGSNKGLTVQAERSFVSGFYILTGASIYNSMYTAEDGVERPTKFDGRYSLMITGGREWNKEVKGNKRSFGVHGRMLYMGGQRDTPIDEDLSRGLGTTTYFSNTNSISLNDYLRFDLRLSWRKDKKNYTRTIALDVQNVAGIKNQAYMYYDAFQGKVVTQYQVGFIPVLVYRIDF